MKKLILVLSLLTLPFITFGQISEKEFEKTIEWINENPSESDNTEFVSKSANLIKFQLFNYPSFPINVSGTKEINKEWKGHKYEKHFLIVYSYNQLLYKLKSKKYNKLNACVFSINQVIKSYTLILEKNPEFRIRILDEYKELDEKKLKKRIKKLL
ncbi:hypothetical protein MED134_03249 [Dokdonia sp. MED134]|uniref:hypothetical protein n=1 Tax=Dokdonia sp. MED134 TaxID=313590 RepID=UPI0000689C4A|nr:hypothetical protein [Dokdonia sp. MED134]EAQ38295.1 hypothetical protein MED134_03249 [Dokdonia sp. MED134]